MKVNDCSYELEKCDNLVCCLEDLARANKRLNECKDLSRESLMQELLEVNLIYNNALGVMGEKSNVLSIESINTSPNLVMNISREGIFSAIGNVFSKIWEWIKAFFKKIKDFFFGESKDELDKEKQEASKEAEEIISKMRSLELKSREDILDELGEHLVSDTKYGSIGYIFRRTELGIAFNDVIDDNTKVFNAFNGYLTHQVETIKNMKRDGGVTTDYAHILQLLTSDSLNIVRHAKQSKTTDNFKKILDGIDYDFNSNPDEEAILEVSKIIDENSKLDVVYNYVGLDTIMKSYRIEYDMDKALAVSNEILNTIKNNKDITNLPINVYDKVSTLAKILKVAYSTYGVNSIKKYKLKSKEVDNVKSSFTNKDNIINFLKNYSIYIKNIDTNAIDKIKKEFDKSEKTISSYLDEVSKANKDRKHWFAFGETAKKDNDSVEVLSNLISAIRNNLKIMSSVYSIVTYETYLITKICKFEKIGKILLSSCFKEEKKVETESYGLDKKSSLTLVSKKDDKVEEPKKPRVIVNFTKILD